MTDKEIVKALECCFDGYCESCVFNDDINLNCKDRLVENALNLIERQKAEIEKLNVELVGMRGACESYKIHYDNAQAEIEDLKKQIKTMLDVERGS